MRKLTFFIAILILSISVKGQAYQRQGSDYLRNVLIGTPLIKNRNNDVKGSAYLFDDWKKGTVTDVAGYVYVNVPVMFDNYSNEFFYKLGDTSYEFVTMIKNVELYPIKGDTATKMIFKKGYNVQGKNMQDKFMQVLVEGKITMLKYAYKTLEEETEFNVAGKIKSFASKTEYFFIRDGVSTAQKPGSKLLENLLSDKWKTVETFIKQNSLSPKNENDCIKILAYYNSL